MFRFWYLKMVAVYKVFVGLLFLTTGETCVSWEVKVFLYKDLRLYKTLTKTGVAIKAFLSIVWPPKPQISVLVVFILYHRLSL